MLEDLRAVVRKIPHGKVSTYGAVAKAAGYPGRARQVAWALSNAGPAALLPWHRVVGAGGKILLRGPNGWEQQLLLRAEGVAFRGERIAMSAHEFHFPEEPGAI